MNKFLKIKLIRGLSRKSEDFRRTIIGLGLRKIGSEVIRDNTPSIRGMVKKVLHLVKVEEIS